jgi:hypothetical protein
MARFFKPCQINLGLTIFLPFANHGLTIEWSIDANERRTQLQAWPCGPALVAV